MPRRSLLAAAALVVLCAIVQGSALRGWWLYDDPQLLIEAIRQTARTLFFDPAEYAHFATHTFTPLLPLSFRLDLDLAGMAPRAFYLHQVIALTAAVVLLSFVLRRYVRDAFAFTGAALFATSWAALYAARTLMIRHYVEGLVVALAALLAFAYRRDRTAALFYLLALLSKEVFAPIPLLFVFQSQFDGDDARTTVRRLFAPAASAIVWLVWRWRMTGLVGDYAAFPTKHDFAGWPRTIGSHFAGAAPHGTSLVWAIAALAIVVPFVVRFRLRGVAFLAAIAVIGLLPVFPLAANFEWRYSFALIAFAIAALAICAGLVGRAMLIPLGALAVTTTLLAHSQVQTFDALTRSTRREGEYVWTQPANAPALAASSPGWYLGGLAWLRMHEQHATAPRYFFSRYPIVLRAIDAYDAVALDPRSGAPLVLATLPPAHPLAAAFGNPAQWHDEASRFDAQLSLAVWFRISQHDAQWRLGPDGTFVFLTDPDWTPIDIPAIGSRRVPAQRERQWFRMLRRAPNGAWTVSPRLPVPYEEQTTEWKRP